MTRKMLMAALLMAAFSQGTQAQDLSGQRSEKQDVNMIPGKKLNHHGLIVSPTPHLLNVDAANRLDLQKGVKVIDKKGKFADESQSLVGSDAVNPASQRAIAPIVAERAIDSHEGFLRG